MLNSILACIKVELQDLTVCIDAYGEKLLKAFSDLDLDPTKLNIELVQAITYTTMNSNFFPRLIPVLVIRWTG